MNVYDSIVLRMASARSCLVSSLKLIMLISFHELGARRERTLSSGEKDKVSRKRHMNFGKVRDKAMA